MLTHAGGARPTTRTDAPHPRREACYSRCMRTGPGNAWLAAALMVVATPALAAGAEGAEPIEDIAEVVRALLPGGTPGLVQVVAEAAPALHRVEVPAAAGKFDPATEIFHVRLLDAGERLLAAVKVDPKGSYLARTRDGYQFKIRRQEVTIHELEVAEGAELAQDIAVVAPRSLAGDLMHGLVAVCEFRVLAGADGRPVRQDVELYPTSVTEPMEGRVITRVLRVALHSVTLRNARTGQVYRRVEAAPAAVTASAALR